MPQNPLYAEEKTETQLELEAIDRAFVAAQMLLTRLIEPIPELTISTELHEMVDAIRLYAIRRRINEDRIPPRRRRRS